MVAKLKNKRTSITRVREQYLPFAKIAIPFIYHYPLDTFYIAYYPFGLEVFCKMLPEKLLSLAMKEMI
jgi:hypothetical protein